MSSSSPTEAIYNHIVTDATLTNLLVDGASGIMLAGRATNATRVPFITIADMPQIGSGYADQYTNPVRLRTHFSERDGSSNYSVGRIISRLKVLLNKADLGVITGGFLECRWNGRTSGQRFDANLSLWFVEVIMNVQMSQKIG